MFLVLESDHSLKEAWRRERSTVYVFVYYGRCQPVKNIRLRAVVALITQVSLSAFWSSDCSRALRMQTCKPSSSDSTLRKC